MPRIKEITVFKFSELSDKAKTKALDKFREWSCQDDWWDYIYDDAETIGLKLTEFDLDRNRHACGKFLIPAIEVIERIKINHGQDCETYKTAIKYEQTLRDYMNLGEDGDAEYQTEECSKEFLDDLLEDYSIMLQKESEYLSSDEALMEMINANDYEFLENGAIA